MPADHADRLADHARARHEQTLQQAQTALADMVKNGETITISRLASKAGVSRSWIYTQPDLRSKIEQAQQDTRSTSRAPAGSQASAESLKRRLELAHQTLARLRAENLQLKQDLARVHGQLRQATTVSPAHPCSSWPT